MADDITLGELGRRMDALALEIREWRQATVGRAEYESDQEGIVRRFEAAERSNSATAREVTALRETVAKTETDRNKEAGQRRFSIAAMLAAPVLSALVAWVVAGGLGR